MYVAIEHNKWGLSMFDMRSPVWRHLPARRSLAYAGRDFRPHAYIRCLAYANAPSFFQPDRLLS